MKKKNSQSNTTFLAKWLAGELSDDELKLLVPESEYASYLKIRKGIFNYEFLESSTNASYRKIKEHISKGKELDKVKVRHLNSNRWLLGIAASIVVLLGLFTLLGDDIVTMETNYGEQKTIVLLDGSEVVLNSKSRLSYNEKEWENSRTLNLEGEAYFKVKKGSIFTVVTDNGEVNVLGTQFNVNSVSDLFEVICFEGKVGVTTKAEDYILLPTNSVRRINGYTAEQRQTKAVLPSWIQGESTFKSVPLKYVITSLESQYDVSFDSKGINNELTYTGAFTHKDLDTALKTVFNSLNIRYIIKDKRTIYLSAK